MTEENQTSLDVILGDEPIAEAVVETPVQTETPEQPSEVETPVEAAQDAPQEPVATEAEQTPADDANKPWGYHAVKDEKAKRQAAQKKAEQLEAQLNAMQWQQKQNAPRVETPDVFTDPDAYTQHVQRQALAPVMPVVQNLQRQLAAQVHGKETFDAANTWFDTLSPQHKASLEQQHGNSPDPYGALVSEYKRSQLLSEIGEDPDAYKQRIIAEHMATQGQQPIPQTSQASQVKLMPSATQVPNTAARGGPVWAGPQSLESILPE